MFCNNLPLQFDRKMKRKKLFRVFFVGNAVVVRWRQNIRNRIIKCLGELKRKLPQQDYYFYKRDAKKIEEYTQEESKKREAKRTKHAKRVKYETKRVKHARRAEYRSR